MTDPQITQRISALEAQVKTLTDQLKAVSEKKTGTPFLLHQSQFPKGIIKQQMLQASTTLAVGDLYYGDGSNNFIRLPIGTTGQKLTVAGGIPTWA